jgi:dolichyl-phosphate-mannose--protein O-mannosyl transferase
MSKLIKKLTSLTLGIPSLIKPIIQNLLFGKKNLIAAIFLLGASFIVYFWQYDKPDAPYWDENYHIASAEKYLEGTYFMEPHPPLGKLIIALSEKVMGTNKSIDKKPMTETDFVNKVPEGYTFKGVRFLPTIFAALIPCLIFLILLLLTNSLLAAFTTALVFLLDNSLVLHFRAAMLDGIQLFFILSALLYFVTIFKKKVRSYLDYIILGLLIGLAVATKLNSLFIALTIPILAFKDAMAGKSKEPLNLFAKTIVGISLIGLVFSGIFYIHYFLGKKINDKEMLYEASPKYEEALKNNQLPSLKLFPTALIDNLKYANSYEKKVPKLDLCKKDENGSLPIGWPLGIKSINYRWEKFSGGEIAYLYLQGNPLVWLTGLVGLLLSLSMIINRFIFRSELKNKIKFNWIFIFTVLYLSYMIAIFQIERVMYLYHYFIPLTLSIILAGLVFDYLFFDKKCRTKLCAYVGTFLVLIFLSFLYYSPFVYFKPLNCSEIKDRSLLKIWQLKCVE